MEASIVIVFIGLFVKHFIADFLIQNRSEFFWRFKGEFGHIGGIVHAFTHFFSSWLMFLILAVSGVVFPASLTISAMTILCIGEAMVHYFIDFAKMNFNEAVGLKCHKDPVFWDMVGLNQFLHYMTYAGMVYLIFFIY